MKPYIRRVIIVLKTWQGNMDEVWALFLQIPILFIYDNNNFKEITYLSSIHVWI